MSSSIEARLEFSFKGEVHTLEYRIELDELFTYCGSQPRAHELLAKKHGIDTYSYLYEVMQEEPIEFSNPQGAASDFMNDGQFDQQAFIAGWPAHCVLDQLKAIASSELSIDDLNQHQALKRALLLAYQLGNK